MGAQQGANQGGNSFGSFGGFVGGFGGQGGGADNLLNDHRAQMGVHFGRQMAQAGGEYVEKNVSLYRCKGDKDGAQADWGVPADSVPSTTCPQTLL